MFARDSVFPAYAGFTIPEVVRPEFDNILMEIKPVKIKPEVWRALHRRGRVGAKRRGSPTDFVLAKIATHYADLCAAGSTNPTKQTANAFNVSPERARDWVHRARVKGFLGPAPKQGSRGGILTKVARDLLARSDQEK